jgi:signal transduction histidine kinase/CheY-like chemotaxis protein
MSGSISLRTQLVLTLVGCILVTAVVLTTLAYQGVQSNLELQARQTVSSAAKNRAEAISSVIAAQQQHAAGFLLTIKSLCGERMPSGKTSFELGCAQRAVDELRANERATGVVLSYRSRRVVSAGRTVQPRLPIPSPLARMVVGPSGLLYVLRVDDGDAAVRLQFPMSDLDVLFGQVAGLGARGEMFLRGGSGAFLTPARYATSSEVTGAGVEATYPCAAGPAQWLDIDYRGVETIHGVHPVSDFADGLCVDAHSSHDEVLAPSRTLLVDLIASGGLLAAVGVLLAILSSWFIASPVQRLALAARAVEAGDFNRPIRIAGPLEVRRLARSFEAMALAVRGLIRREQDARHEAESASRAKDEFLAVLSHELRTPLTATLGWIRLLRAGTLSSGQAEKALDAIDRSANTQAQLVEDLLDISRIVADRLQLQHTELSFAETVRGAVDGARPAADEKGVAIECELGTPAIVFGDPLRLQQVAANLIINAVKFTPAGGRVIVRLAETDAVTELTVTDTGIGISADFLPRMFEAFCQADAGSTRAHGGMGLGLSIVKHLVRLHGGTVEAASNGPGRGATFTVRLPKKPGTPAARVASADVPQPVPLIDEKASGPRLAAVRVLLVEDDDDTRHVLAALLEDAGAQVDAAASAEEGRRYLAIRDYKAIVSDLAMPKETGFAFLRAIRSTDNKVPAIALTALARREDATEAYASGFQMYLRKPVDRDQLVRAVARVALS